MADKCEDCADLKAQKEMLEHDKIALQQKVDGMQERDADYEALLKDYQSLGLHYAQTCQLIAKLMVILKSPIQQPAETARVLQGLAFQIQSVNFLIPKPEPTEGG